MTSDTRTIHPARVPKLYCLVLLIVVAPWSDFLSLRPVHAAPNDHDVVSALDKEYQLAVKNDDAVTMSRILADDFILVTGSGKTYTKTDMLAGAKGGDSYTHNDEETQTVRIWGDTAVVTAKLWEQYTSDGHAYDHTFWFSDVYVRRPGGWKYVFGQSSTPLRVR